MGRVGGEKRGRSDVGVVLMSKVLKINKMKWGKSFQIFNMC